MKAVVIGASSGGPSTLEFILGNLPEDLDAYVIIVQHLPEKFTGTMSARLDELFSIKVVEITHKMPLQKSVVHIVPGGHHLFITNPGNVCYLIKADSTNVPSIDMGFTSVAEHFGKDTIGVVLTGMGEDGVIGAKAIKQLGGHVIAQDESTSLVYGMPFAVKIAGYADEILPQQKIPERIIQLTGKKGNAK